MRLGDIVVAHREREREREREKVVQEFHSCHELYFFIKRNNSEFHLPIDTFNHNCTP